MKKLKRVLVRMHGSVLHNAVALLVRQNPAGSSVLQLDEDRGAYRKGDKLTVGPGEFSELLHTVKT